MKIKYSFTLFFIYVFCFSLNAKHTAIIANACACNATSDSLVLIDLYNATNGASWTIPWILSNPKSTWHGVNTNGNGCVMTLYLENNNLDGTIPSSMGNLEELISLRFHNNNLSGSIPKEISLLSKLVILSLHTNQLTGNIPVEFGILSDLSSLLLSDNQLVGNIPSELGDLSNLRYLNLTTNQLTGNILEELGLLSNLINLSLTDNQLTGNIPSILGNLNQLTSLSLNNNALEGNIPVALANLSNLTFLNLSHNQLTGCFEAGLLPLCDNAITVLFNDNSGLPNNGDFAAFCANGTGGCNDNDECIAAISLPMNVNPCGKDSKEAILNSATTSGTGPFGNCKTTFQSKDVWFKAIVPSTGNLLIRKETGTNIRLYVEASLGCPMASSDTIVCYSLALLPNVMIIDNQTPGDEIYFRVWDSLNLVVNQSSALVEISAHELPSNPDEWVLCDFPSDTINEGAGLKKAKEFIVQYDEDDTPDSIAYKRNILITEFGATLLDSCDCSAKNLEVWKSENPIDLEVTRRGARKRGNVDTTSYNYVIQAIPLVDEFEESVVPINNVFNQRGANVGMDSLGNYVVAYVNKKSSLSGDSVWVYARLFDKNGTPTGEEFRVSNSILGPFNKPGISMRKNGDFVIVWKDIDSNTSKNVIWAKWFDTMGNSSLSKIAEDGSDGFGAYTVHHADVAINKDGNSVIVFQKNHGSTILGNIVSVHLYQATGNDVTNSTFVNSQDLNDHSYERPKVAMADNGQFIVTFSAYTGSISPIPANADSLEVFKQSFMANGNTIGSEVAVNPSMANAQINPRIAMDATGNAFIAWIESSSSDDGNIKGRRYDAAGAPTSGEIAINNYTTSVQKVNDVAMNDNGDHIIVWESLGQDGDANGVYSQYFDRNNNAVGDEFRVNDLASGGQRGAAVAINDLGNVIYAWRNDKGIDYDVMDKRYISDPFNAPLKSQITSADTIGIDKDDYNLSTYNPQNTVGNIIVATMDSGIDDAHTRFQNALWQYSGAANCVNNATNDIGYDFNHNDGDPNDLDGHGTAVNGLIVENFPNDLQLDLMNVKFFEQGESTLFDAICGIYYAIENGAKVINLSWGFEAAESPAILEEAIETALCNDVLIITSAGNDGKDNGNIQKYPANFSKADNHVISVAAYELDENGQNPQLSGYSNFSAQNVDIAARGFIETTGLDGSLVTLSGTSLSAPIVARIAAIIRARYPQLSAVEVKDCIINSDNVSYSGFPVRSGGALNETAALACAQTKANAGTPLCESDKLQLNANITDESCAGGDGNIELIITGTSTTNSILWYDNSTNSSKNNLAIGNYQVTVTDECGCIKTLSLFVNSNCNGGFCESGIMIMDNPVQGRIYRHANTLESDDTIAANLQTTFQAGMEIILKAGFTVEKGADFYALINSCNAESFVDNPVYDAKIKPQSESIQMSIFPNPVFQNATVRFYIPKDNKQTVISLMDLSGRQLMELYNGNTASGWNEIPIQNHSLLSGMYLVALQSSEATLVQKIIVTVE